MSLKIKPVVGRPQQCKKAFLKDEWLRASVTVKCHPPELLPLDPVGVLSPSR